MAIDHSNQSTLETGVEPELPTHLTDVDPSPPNVPDKPPADGDREAYCRQCNNRVTRAPGKEGDSPGEYGHETTCPHHYVGSPGGSDV